MNTHQVSQMWVSIRLTLDNTRNTTTLFAESERLPFTHSCGGAGSVYLWPAAAGRVRSDLPGSVVSREG